MKRLLTLTFIVALAASVRGMPRQGRIDTGTDKGAQEVRIALPVFECHCSDPNAVKLTNLFNQVVWDDLDFSGNVALVSRSFYPLGKFQEPSDIKPDDWTKNSVNAQYLAFGFTELTGG